MPPSTHSPRQPLRASTASSSAAGTTASSVPPRWRAAGRSVLVLEAHHQVGGAALTREFAPGFQVSACAHLVHLMPAALVEDLRLSSHGLKWAAQSMPTTALVADGAPLAIGADLPGADATAYGRYSARMGRFARALVPLLSRVPPRLGTGDWRDALALLGLGWRIRRLGRRDMRELLRIGGMNVHDLLEEQFESPALQGALAFDAVLGTNFGPRSPGTVLTLLYRLAAEAAGGGALSQPQGGVGALVRCPCRGRVRGRRRDSHRRAGGAYSGRGRSCSGRRARIRRAHRGRCRDLERRSENHLSATARRALLWIPASCAASITCGRAAWPRSCIWRSIVHRSSPV